MHENLRTRHAAAQRVRLGRALSLLTVAFVFSSVVSGQTSKAPAARISCTIGPLTKTIGGNPWLVYACSDGKSVAVVSTPNVAPTWFYFVVAPDGDGHAISGEVSGNKSVTQPVFDELSAMSPDAVAALYQEVQASVEADAAGSQPPDDLPERTRDP